MMRPLAFALLVAFACAAHAQPDCPPRNAPVPTSPPGPPPDFVPNIDFPKTWDENVATPRPSGVEISPPDNSAERKARDWIMDVEDGHVAGLAFLASRVRREAPPGAGRLQVKVGATPLATWELLGYAPTGSPNRVSRLFRRSDGSLLALEEWDFATDGGAIYQAAGMKNARVGAHAATLTGMRGKSGCVASTLSWFDARESFELKISGPPALAEQRATLQAIAESIEKARDAAR